MANDIFFPSLIGVLNAIVEILLIELFFLCLLFHIQQLVCIKYYVGQVARWTMCKKNPFGKKKIILNF